MEIQGEDHIEKVILSHAGADVGQGAHTIFLKILSETMHVDPSIIEMRLSDTATTMDSGSASASRLTFMAGNSILGAAREAMKKWKEEERPAIATYTYLPPRTTPMDPQNGSSMPNFSYGYVAEAVELDVDAETGKISLSGWFAQMMLVMRLIPSRWKDR